MHQSKNNIFEQVIERAKGMCEVCGEVGTEIHHCIFGNGKRKQHETVDSIICLCWNCHHGTSGVHGRDGRELDLKLKVKLQETYFKHGHTEEEVREMMGGKLYEM